MDRILSGLLIFVPLTVVGHIFAWPPILVLLLASLAIIPLARYIGEATEILSIYVGQNWGGLLNATFGNLTELIICIFALNKGLGDVVKASITGSIIGNLLLILGLAIFIGGLRRREMKFKRTAAVTNSLTLILSVIALVMPAVFVQTVSGSADWIVEELSLLVSGLMLVLYGASLVFMFKTHAHLYAMDIGRLEAKWTKRKCMVVLLASTLGVAAMSEILVGAIEPVVVQLGWTQLFIGVIFIAVIGNAAEHTSAILMAQKNKMDLVISIAVGSALQIALFVAPVLVFVSYFMGRQMNLVFNTFELVAIILTVLITNVVVEDGKSNWLEGLQLLVAYAIMGVVFFFHP